METEIKETLIDRFNSFQAEVRKLQAKPQGLEQELSAKKGKLVRLKRARSSQLALDETEKAKVLAKEIEKLAEEVEVVEAKAAAFGPGGSQSAQKIVENAPDSDLYNQAMSIVQEAAEIAPGLEKELQYFVNWGAEEQKEKYLKVIEDFSEKLSELWEISFAGLTAQKYLPEDVRHCKKPRLIAPGQNHFKIGVLEVGELYKPLSRVNLPD